MWIPENWNEQPSEQKLKWFGRCWLPLACGLGAWFCWQKDQQGFLLALSLMGLVILICGWCRPSVLLVLYSSSRFIGLFTAWVLTIAVLTLAYVLLITPLAYWLRFRKHDPLQLKIEKEKATYWETVSTDHFPEDALRPY